MIINVFSDLTKAEMLAFLTLIDLVLWPQVCQKHKLQIICFGVS